MNLRPQNNTDYMSLALEDAAAAGARGEIPVGAVLVEGASGKIIARAGNLTEARHDATAHAEMLVLQAGGQALGTPRLVDCDLYVSLEPCPMCAAAISFARIRRLYFGAYDPKGGGVEHGARIYNQPSCHHKPEVYGGLREQDSAALLKAFFAERR